MDGFRFSCLKNSYLSTFAIFVTFISSLFTFSFFLTYFDVCKKVDPNPKVSFSAISFCLCELEYCWCYLWGPSWVLLPQPRCRGTCAKRIFPANIWEFFLPFSLYCFLILALVSLIIVAQYLPCLPYYCSPILALFP